MAIDQSQLLQMLLQGSGGGISISPTSGLQDPSLSGLALGPQGMGLGGGESLLGGGGGLGGGEGGPGLDILTLLSQLQSGGGGVGAPSQNLLGSMGAGSLGAGFGAGGQLQPQQFGVPSGTVEQSGLGALPLATGFLGTLKEALGLGRTISGGPTPASPTVPGSLGGASNLGFGTTLGTQFGQGAIGASPFGPLEPGFGAAGQALSGSAPSTVTGTLSPTALDALTGTTAPNLGNAGAQFAQENAGLLGVGGIGGVGGSAPVSAPFLAGGGPESVGALTEGGTAATGGVGGASNLFGNLGAGVGGALGLSQAISRPDVLGRATGAAEAAIATAAIASGQPELALLAFIPGAADLLGGLFGGGGPSQREINQAQAAQVGQAGAQQFAGGLQAGGGSAASLLEALGGVPGLGDQFGQSRTPISASLQLPPDIVNQIGLGGGMPLPDRGIVDFEFSPSRAFPGAPGSVLGLPGFTQFLNAARANPSLLNYIQGSGDVSYLPQGQAQALAAQNQAAAQNAIRAFLGIAAPSPAMAPAAAPPPSFQGNTKMDPQLLALLKDTGLA